MWNNYGRVFAEYLYMKNFRNGNLSKNISIEGEDILLNIKDQNQKVVFISGHFSNFELMAMQIDKIGIKIGAIYRPCLLYTSPSPRDLSTSRMPSSA